MTVGTQARQNVAARIRGTVAIRIVGELISRLAGGEGWDFAAFGRDDDTIISGASSHQPVDISTLRSQVRLQRFAGTALPHAGTGLGSEHRRWLYVLFGEFGERMAVLRILRGEQAKAFGPRDGAGIERFFRQHGNAIAAAIFDISEDSDRVVAQRALPIAFTIDATGALLSTIDEPDDESSSLRAHLLPRDGEVPAVLRSVISELLERYHSGAGAEELVCVLPFALVRLAPLRSRSSAAKTLLVTVEWLRSRASLEVTAAQYSISKRELQVLSAMLRGAPVAVIASELSISESTVVFHLKRMLKKTLSKNRTELAARMLGWDISAVS